jgi:hypothetical protein
VMVDLASISAISSADLFFEGLAFRYLPHRTGVMSVIISRQNRQCANISQPISYPNVDIVPAPRVSEGR